MLFGSVIHILTAEAHFPPGFCDCLHLEKDWSKYTIIEIHPNTTHLYCQIRRIQEKKSVDIEKNRHPKTIQLIHCCIRNTNRFQAKTLPTRNNLSFFYQCDFSFPPYGQTYSTEMTLIVRYYIGVAYGFHLICPSFMVNSCHLAYAMHNLVARTDLHLSLRISGDRRRGGECGEWGVAVMSQEHWWSNGCFERIEREKTRIIWLHGEQIGFFAAVRSVVLRVHTNAEMILMTSIKFGISISHTFKR